ncbi:hypothetical protein EIP91_003562 [Steccherinum ochraceum]|uniref:Aldehyde dehydrogenase n=1 Tax=Steccherinum ochraceum TaxID=92696 RepID=A0A4R0RM00_9APHY|nr:hypothetical protein EIP91_003562 [Steccherinum ochraceum]
MVEPTAVDEIPKIREELQQSFLAGKMRPISYRREQIAKLAHMVSDHQEEFTQAMNADLGRSATEADFLDIQPTLREISEAYHSVEKWSKPDRVPFSLNWFVMSPSIRKDPKGMVLIISPFNFPMLLILGPLAGALAAGCTVVIKPSELSPAISGLIAKYIPQYLDRDVCRVVMGAVPETTKLLELPWDHILYTGSGKVAKVVLSSAAKHLTSVTTELGGKNPVVIDPKSDLKLAARRIMWGKFANCGQTCAAPDYLLVPQEIEEVFTKELLDVHSTFYPEGPRKSDSYPRMATKQHALRMKKLIEETNGKIIIGGETEVEDRFIAPTIVKNIHPNDILMEDEIFGPILPIVTVKNVDEAIQIINKREHALTVYVFSQDATFRNKVFDNTRSGAAIANEMVIYHATDGLPFGGVGASGSGGATTGKYNFDIFTHSRATLVGRGFVDTLVLSGRYPPHTPEKTKALRAAARYSLPPRPRSLFASGNASGSRWGLWFVLALVAAAASAAARLTNFRSLLLGAAK